MIFSKQNDFLFIKGRKVAGTSAEMALSTICGPEDIITPITPIDELERLRRRVGEGTPEALPVDYVRRLTIPPPAA